MEPLVTNQRCLIWLCMCPADEFTSRWQKLAHITFTITGLVLTAIGIVGGLTFCMTFVSIDLGRSMFSCVFVVAEFSVIYMALVALLLMRHKIGSIFDNLTKICKNAGEYSIEKVAKKEEMNSKKNDLNIAI